MDIDIPEDYVFHAPDEDSDHESHPISVLVYSPSSEAKVDGHSSDEEIVMIDSNQFGDREIGLDELVSDPEMEDEDEEMQDSKEEDPEEEE